MSSTAAPEATADGQPASRTRPKVLIVGGGIAGLTVAHELTRVGGFDVTVCEQNLEFGGKARSLRADGLPIEHAMRVLLASYTCLYRVMSEVPAAPGAAGNSLYDHLTYPRFSFRYQGNEYCLDAEFKSIWTTLRDWLGIVLFFHRCGVPLHELVYFLYKVGRLLWLTPTAVAKELGSISFEDYLEVSQRTRVFRDVLLRLSEMLVAAKRTASAAVNARLVLEWFVGPFLRSPFARRGFASLNGPTSERLIDPWVAELKRAGVTLLPRTRVDEIDEFGRQIQLVRTVNGDELKADVYCLCLPHNVLDALVSNQVKRFVPTIASLTPLGEEWSAGLQYFLTHVPQELEGREGRITIAADSPWSIVFMLHAPGAPWEGVPLPPGVVAVLSAVVSNSRNLGTWVKKPFIRCTQEEILEETLHQIGVSGPLADAAPAPSNRRVGPDLEYWARKNYEEVSGWFTGYGVSLVHEDLVLVSDGLLYVRAPGNDALEPPNDTDIHNLFIAGEFTRTRYSTPTMEKSCESGMRCARAICDAFGRVYDESRLAGAELPMPWLRSTRLRLAIGSALLAGLAAGLAWALLR